MGRRGGKTDIDFSATVVLDDLIGSVIGSSADDPGLVVGAIISLYQAISYRTLLPR